MNQEMRLLFIVGLFLGGNAKLVFEQEGCNDPGSGEILESEERVILNNCEIRVCHDGGFTTKLRCQDFPDVGIPENCEILPGIHNRSFPDCCNLRICIHRNEITYEETTLNGEYRKTKKIMSRNQTSNNNCPELNEDTSSIVVYNPHKSRCKIEPKYEIESHREKLIETNEVGNLFMGDENVIVLKRSKRGIDYEVLQRSVMDENNEAMALEQIRQSKALGSGQYTHDIYRQCYDPYTKKVYALGETWKNPTKCQLFTCAYLTKIRDAHFAIVKQINCMQIRDRTSDCRFLPELDATRWEFPMCCMMKVCIKANIVNITRTDAAGDLVMVVRPMINPAGNSSSGGSGIQSAQQIKRQCTDPTKPGKFYMVNESWPIEGVCGQYFCDNLTLEATKGNYFAIANRIYCANLTLRETDCEILPALKNNPRFPECCPIKVCITGNLVKFTQTTARGDAEDSHRVLIKPKKAFSAESVPGIPGIPGILPPGLKSNQIVQMPAIFKWPGYTSQFDVTETTTIAPVEVSTSSATTAPAEVS